MQIGRFRSVGDGYVGRLQTLGLDVPLRLVPTQLDCPTLSHSLRANLVPARGEEDGHILLWSRSLRSRRGD